jgi:hypothetical protein
VRADFLPKPCFAKKAGVFPVSSNHTTMDPYHMNPDSGIIMKLSEKWILVQGQGGREYPRVAGLPAWSIP